MDSSTPINIENWKVEKIGVIGPGIVGMPMAAMLADARIKIGTDQPARIIIVQRDSPSSGWKVDAINRGESVIGGIEPGLDSIVKNNVDAGILSATNNFFDIYDADVILVSVQTDKNGFAPDYGPMFGALDKLGEALARKPADKVPLIIFESTLAPTTMDTLFREHFRKYGLEEGKDIMLGNSPNRVMPGRLVERIKDSDKLAGGLHPVTPLLIEKLYKHIVTKGTIFRTNSLTAEIVKTLENAYRDVRIAFSTEIVRYCDKYNVDFYTLRDNVNLMLQQNDNASIDPNAVPSGGILIPMLGVGGHCLPKDGILLWWRDIESGTDTSNSLILRSRDINDGSPDFSFRRSEDIFGNMKENIIALLGVAYRFNSEDTRNSPALVLANSLRKRGYSYIMHDPYVRKHDQNLLKFNQQDNFTNDLTRVLNDAEIIILCTSHKYYSENFSQIISGSKLKAIFDACNIYSEDQFDGINIAYSGIGRGKNKPGSLMVNFVYNSFREMEKGIANELQSLIQFYNDNYAYDEYNKVKFEDIQRLARTCSTGCEIADPGIITVIPEYNGFRSNLVECAYHAQGLTE